MSGRQLSKWEHLKLNVTALEESVIDYGMAGDLEAAANYLHVLHTEIAEYPGDDFPDAAEYDANVDDRTLQKVLDWAEQEDHDAAGWYRGVSASEGEDGDAWTCPICDDPDPLFPSAAMRADGGGGDDA